MITADLDVARSILLGRRVPAFKLDSVVLRRAFRGADLPPPGDYIEITADMLDAVAEGGPLDVSAASVSDSPTKQRTRLVGLAARATRRTPKGHRG